MDLEDIARQEEENLARGGEPPANGQNVEAGNVPYNDQGRRQDQRRNQERFDAESEEERNRQQSIVCYLMASMIIWATPFKDCTAYGIPSKYSVDMRQWILVYLLISVL